MEALLPEILADGRTGRGSQASEPRRAPPSPRRGSACQPTFIEPKSMEHRWGGPDAPPTSSAHHPPRVW